MNPVLLTMLRNNLALILNEICDQPEVSKHFSPHELSYQDWTNQIREWIDDSGEYGVAYESIVASLEIYPFVLSGLAATKLLEIGLSLGYKTEREKDSAYDLRGRFSDR